MDGIRPADLVMPDDFRDVLLAFAEHEAPDEVCGLLGAANGLVCIAHVARNGHRNPSGGFVMNPLELQAVESMWTASGVQLVAAFHSHPRTPAVPSPRDLLFADDELLTVIVSLAPRQVRAWKTAAGEAIELDLGARQSMEAK
jgi:proteasome lid subunit RPN8/RPN11